MSYYETGYKNRLNRYGLNYQQRVQGQREREFENYLLKTIYRIDVSYNDSIIPASFEPYKQDETQTIHYLLTRVTDKIPNGTILDIQTPELSTEQWMVWWLESLVASGYNRYIMLKVTSQLTINHWEYYGFLKGPGDRAIKDTVKSASKLPYHTIDDNLRLFIMPAADIQKGDYVEYTHESHRLAYTVSGIDITTTPGIIYVSLDPTTVHNESESTSELAPDDPNAFWLTGGV